MVYQLVQGYFRPRGLEIALIVGFYSHFLALGLSLFSQNLHISFTNVHKSILPQMPPWIIKKPRINLQFNKLHKTKHIPALIWKNFTLSSYTILTINLYLRMAPKITVKQYVLLSSIKPFTRKPLQ